jgi:hypothetical protein
MQKGGMAVVLRALLLLYVVSVPSTLLLFVAAAFTTRRERRKGEIDRAQSEQCVAAECREGRLKRPLSLASSWPLRSRSRRTEKRPGRRSSLTLHSSVEAAKPMADRLGTPEGVRRTSVSDT